jgi:predicted membrane protein (TIGR00267 family)
MIEPVEQIRDHMNLVNGWTIFRRYLVMNAFDGILSVFGIVLGSYLVGVEDPKQILVSGFGAAIAIGVSGVYIAYLTETAELSKERQELERKMLTNLQETRYERANRTSNIINSMINGLSPFGFGMLTLSPFALAGIIGISTAYLLSFAIGAVLLVILGILLGSIADANKWIFGIKTLFAGVLVAIFLLLLP